ncbi:tRNA-specific adenosine deaminase [Chromatiales bacterium (ex Bugula neritina AB1)]|nr:tRNA-specific adenosine deaminase [Chromatiales bacterium (ex Bugula neritina AB1)]
MHRCLELAQRAAAHGEVPVGAVIVQGGNVIAEACNQPIGRCDPTAHAEICAIRLAATVVENYRLVGCTIYSSIEPCLMCAGAVMHARLDRIVYGAPEPRAGAVSGNVNYFDALQHFHKIEVIGNILSDESRALIQKFFRDRRK